MQGEGEKQKLSGNNQRLKVAVTYLLEGVVFFGWGAGFATLVVAALAGFFVGTITGSFTVFFFCFFLGGGGAAMLGE